MRTQVGIVGAGPAGLFLSLLLHRAGVDCIVLEAKGRDYVESRVRAGVLEQGTVDLMDELAAGERLHREGMPDPRLDIRFNGGIIHIDLPVLTPGKIVTVYGQQEVVKDLIAARLNRGAIPEHLLTVYDRIYPFGWLGILAEAKPFPEMSYSSHESGFALASRRSPKLSRLYVQCPVDDDLAEWPERRIWDELHLRLYDKGGAELQEGPILQQAIVPLRAFVAAPMRHGRMFLAGDAAHIVPPTGAKGLNLAAADIRVLSRALIEFFRLGATERLDRYSDTCLKRVWKVVRYSNYMTSLLHRFETHSTFERRVQQAELEYVAGSLAARTTIGENYVGLPFEED